MIFHVMLVMPRDGERVSKGLLARDQFMFMLFIFTWLCWNL